MKYDPDKGPVRLKNHDYSLEGNYFITFNTAGRNCCLSTIENGQVILSPIGKRLEYEWMSIPLHRPSIEIGEFVIMPDHFHGIISIQSKISDDFFSGNRFGKPVAGSVSMAVNHVKGSVKRWCNRNDYEWFSWQPKFFDRVIRNHAEYQRISDYILNNPLRWINQRL